MMKKCKTSDTLPPGSPGPASNANSCLNSSKKTQESLLNRKLLQRRKESRRFVPNRSPNGVMEMRDIKVSRQNFSHLFPFPPSLHGRGMRETLHEPGPFNLSS